MSNVDGSSYRGEYKYGKYHGNGTLVSSDGSTYIGLATDHFTDWQEGASQELLNATTLNPEPMQAGETYNLTIDLRGFPVVGGTYTDEAELLIYGGFMT